MENGQPGVAELSAETRRMYSCVHFDPEEAEFGAAEGRARTADERN